jgi:transcriptional regulator GlxA family with amidase domain
MPHHEVNEVGIPRYVAIFIKPSFLEEQSRAYISCALDLEHWSTFDCNEELLYAVKRFIGENQHPKPASDILLEAISTEIVHILLRSMLSIQVTESAYVSRIEINRSIEYMRQNLSEKLTLPVLAAYANMSVSHFTRIFRMEIGRSPIDYLIEMRLEVACRKLLGNDVSLKQIAMECGFSSPAHFSSSFLKKYAMAPSEYLHASRSK